MSWIAVGSLAVSAGVSIYNGIKQKNEAKKKLAEINGKEVPQALLDNQKLATQMANEGMPSEQYAQAQRNIDRNNAIAIQRANSRRAAIGLLPSLQQATNDAYLNLDAQNAAMRNRNKALLMNANSQIGAAQNQKYQADYNYAQSLMGAGNQNIQSGIDSGISAIGAGVGGVQNARKTKNMFGSSYNGYI